MTNLWKEETYLQRIPYLVGKYITEYDLSKANITALLYKGIISNEDYNAFYNMDKFEREVRVGMMQRNNSAVSDAISEGIMEFRKMFCSANDIDDDRILSIKKDALFIIGDQCQHVSFGQATFAIKNMYQLYMYINKLEIYYGCDPINQAETIDIKGISDEKLEAYHVEYMIRFLCDVFYTLLKGDTGEAVKYSQELYMGYLHKTLPVGFYRTFDARSSFQFKTHSSCIEVMDMDKSMIPDVDISTNIKFIRELIACISSIYMHE